MNIMVGVRARARCKTQGTGRNSKTLFKGGMDADLSSLNNQGFVSYL